MEIKGSLEMKNNLFDKLHALFESHNLTIQV